MEFINSMTSKDKLDLIELIESQISLDNNSRLPYMKITYLKKRKDESADDFASRKKKHE